MTPATLAQIALLPSDARLAAIDDLVELLLERGISEAELEQLERDVGRVNASIAQWARPN